MSMLFLFVFLYFLERKCIFIGRVLWNGEGITPGGGKVGETQISKKLEVLVTDELESAPVLLHLVRTGHFHRKLPASLPLIWAV